MTALLIVAVLLLAFYGLIITLGGIKAIRRVHELTVQRDEARYAAAEQAEDIQAKHDTIQRACQIMRELLEALPEDEKWQDVEDYVTENAVDGWAA